jgi:hypothetical protein
MTAYSTGSTTDISCMCASFAGFIVGHKFLQGNRFSYFHGFPTGGGGRTVDATYFGTKQAYHLLTIQNKRWYGEAGNERVSQIVLNILSISAAVKHTNPAIVYLVKNGTLNENSTSGVNYENYSSESASAWTSVAETVQWTDNKQLIWTGHLGDIGELDHHFTNGTSGQEIILQPGETISVCVNSVTGNISTITASLNTKEDQ